MSNSGSSLRLQGVIYLHTFGFLSLIHSICLAPCSVSFSPSLSTIFFSVHWSYFLLLHMDFFKHPVGSEERLQITQILSHFSLATLQERERFSFLASILKHNERIPVSIVLALCQIFHGLSLDAHHSHKGQSVWLTTSRELHEFKEEHFSNGGGGVLSSVEGEK